jgi:homoserine kinase type II
MAVYTEVSFDEARTLLARLGLGELQRLQGIASGIENTNYFADTSQGRWVLTVFERLPPQALPYYLSLMQHAAQHGIPAPEPQAGPDGGLLHQLAGKPAAVVSRLAGHPVMAPSAVHCAQLGQVLGQWHRNSQSFALRQARERALPWMQATVPQVLPYLPPATAQLLTSELAWQSQAADSAAVAALPQGPVHADLFRDNALFDETGSTDESQPRPAAPRDGPAMELVASTPQTDRLRLSGLLDFYFAGHDALLFDLAVSLNDWCIDDADGRLEPQRAQALVDAYAGERPLQPQEVRLLPLFMRQAALRFWLSRLWDWHLPRPAALLSPKDPGHFERVLRQRIDNPWHPET